MRSRINSWCYKMSWVFFVIGVLFMVNADPDINADPDMKVGADMNSDLVMNSDKDMDADPDMKEDPDINADPDMMEDPDMKEDSDMNANPYINKNLYDPLKDKPLFNKDTADKFIELFPKNLGKCFLTEDTKLLQFISAEGMKYVKENEKEPNYYIRPRTFRLAEIIAAVCILSTEGYLKDTEDCCVKEAYQTFWETIGTVPSDFMYALREATTFFVRVITSAKLRINSEDKSSPSDTGNYNPNRERTGYSYTRLVRNPFRRRD